MKITIKLQWCNAVCARWSGLMAAQADVYMFRWKWKGIGLTSAMLIVFRNECSLASLPWSTNVYTSSATVRFNVRFQCCFSHNPVIGHNFCRWLMPHRSSWLCCRLCFPTTHINCFPVRSLPQPPICIARAEHGTPPKYTHIQTHSHADLSVTHCHHCCLSTGCSSHTELIKAIKNSSHQQRGTRFW